MEASDPPPAGHWANYPLTVVRRVAQNFGEDDTGRSLRGGTIAFSSTLPQAAGMSSSSAMVVAFFLALRSMNELAARPRYRDHLQRPEALAQYLGAVESGQPFGPLAAQTGVGTFGGSEDHTAILCAAPGELRRFRYCPVRFEESVPFPDDHRFVVAVSGVQAEKTGAARDRYNRASKQAAAAAAAWRTSTGYDDPHLGAAMTRADFAFERMRAALRAEAADPEPLIQRAEHFYVENQEVLPAAIEALRAEDGAAFGTAVRRSQRAAEQLLGNQVPETMFLARVACRQGAVAASSFGAGFGGAVWALVPGDEVERFRVAWSDAYAAEFPERADAARFFAERPGPAAFTL
jgi:galactokinase